jgi:hypothetical protein
MIDIRQWHSYIGVFIAPSVIFFALTGSLQLFSLHEAHGAYKPWPLIEKLANVHKDQVLEKKEHEDRDAHDAGHEAAVGAGKEDSQDPDHDEDAKVGTQVLKWFFLFVSVGLTTSTLLGLWIGLRHPRRKRLSLILLVLGVALPIGVLAI